MSTGKKIKSIRENWNMTQEDFGNIFGLTRQTIINVERNSSKKTQKIIIDFLIKNKGYKEEYFYKDTIEEQEDTFKDKYITMLEEKLAAMGGDSEKDEMILRMFREQQELRAKLETIDNKLDEIDDKLEKK